jgi:cytochrome b561
MRLMHWTTVALLLSVYPLALAVEDAASASEARRLIMLHRSLGLTVLLVTLVRLMGRQRTRIPPLPADLPRSQRFAARANVVALYSLLLAQPVLGLTASWLHGDLVTFFGVVALPAPLALDRPLSRLLFWLHGWSALLLLAAIGAHVAAALYHHFIRKDEVLSGMLGTRLAHREPDPRARERPLGSDKGSLGSHRRSSGSDPRSPGSEESAT